MKMIQLHTSGRITYLRGSSRKVIYASDDSSKDYATNDKVNHQIPLMTKSTIIATADSNEDQQAE